MVLVPFTPADVQTFPQAIVIAMATHWTPWAFAVVLVRRMRMQMEFVMTRIHVLANSTNAVFAMVTAALAPILVLLPTKHLLTR